MSILGDILSVRLRNRALLIRMIAEGEHRPAPGQLRAELLGIAADLERDAERAMAGESKRGGSI